LEKVPMHHIPLFLVNTPFRQGRVVFFEEKSPQKTSTLPLTSLIFAVFFDLYLLYLLIGNNIMSVKD